jgi:protein-S-isoprenylcysteine O-methyltransferase Ste14
MDRPQTSQPQSRQQDPDTLATLGAWLFRQRSWLPVPLALVILLWPVQDAPSSLAWAGLAVVAAGEALRLAAVRHIGVVSRTRIDRSGPLVRSGPFARVRNPLYLGNIALWIGFALSAGVPWLVPFVVLLLGIEYRAIVRWEETLLESRLGERYRSYAARVPRWIPQRAQDTTDTPPPFSWRDTFFSERGTLIAIVVGCVLVWVKYRLWAPGSGL